MSDNNLDPQQINKPSTTNTKGPLIILKSLKFIVPVCILLIGILSFVVIKTNNLINIYNDKVYPGSYVFDKDVSGFTSTELHTLIEDIIKDINSKKIVVTANEKNFDLPFNSLEFVVNYSDFEKEILNYGKSNSFLSKVTLINKPKKRTYEFKRIYNEDKLNEFVTSVSNAINLDPIDASISISGDSINITPEVIGYKLNSDELLNTLKSTLDDINAKEVTSINGNVSVIDASIKATALNTVNSKISTFTTHYPGGPSGTNLQIAANNINNTLLMPGETFSTEKGIGPTTLDRGFVPANTYVAGKVVPGIGGGVCQVASTLYNTILRAGIIPSERMNHMMKVAYVPIGLDATLADNLLDLKFVNTYEFPIVIKAAAGSGSLTIDFWSNDTAKKGITYEPVSVPLSDLSADAYLYGYNSNGEQVFSQYLDRSTYQPFQ